MNEINSTVTRRIRIWEGEKCIMAIDLQGDTIVTRPKKKNLKVSYEAFDIPMYSDVKMTNYQKIKEAKRLAIKECIDILSREVVVLRKGEIRLKHRNEAFQYAIYLLNHLIKEEYES